MSDWRSLKWKHGFLPSTYVLDRAGVNANGREGFLPLEGAHIHPVQLFFRNTQTTGIGTKYDAITTAGTSADTSVTNTTAGGAEIQATKTAGGDVVEFIGGRTPVGGATFTSAVIYFWAKASLDTVNAGIRFRIYKRTNAGVETELTGSPFDGAVALSTFSTRYEILCNFADTALAEDDRLVFKPYLVNIGTMGVGTVTLSFNGAISAITPVAFDAVSNSAGHGGANPSSPITFSHTCSGSDRYLEVDITVGTPTAPDSDIAITGVTYNGVSLTQVPGSLVHSGGTNRGYCVKYYLVAPATGTNTVSISFTNSSPEALDVIACAAKSFNNVNQTAPFSNLVSATGTSPAPGVNATSRLGSMVSDVLVDGSAITSSGKTIRWNNDVNPNSAGGNGAGATADGASTVRMSYSGSTDDWAIVAYSINPVDGDNSFIYVFPAVTFKDETPAGINVSGAAVELADIGSASVSPQVALTGAAVELADIGSASVSPQVALTGAAVELADVGSASVGPQVAITGTPVETLDVGNAQVTAVANTIDASGAAVELADIGSASVGPQVAVIGTSVELADVGSASVGPQVALTGAATELADVGSASVSPQVAVTGTPVELSDIGNAQGTVITGTVDVSGSAYETQDIALYTDVPAVQETHRPRSLKLQPIRDSVVLAKGATLSLSAGTITARSLGNELPAVTKDALVKIPGARLLLNSGVVNTTATRISRVSVKGSKLPLLSNPVSTSVSTTNIANGVKLSLRTGVADSYIVVKAKAEGYKLRLRTGTVDDVYGAKNPSDEELALLAIKLATKYIK